MFFQDVAIWFLSVMLFCFSANAYSGELAL